MQTPPQFQLEAFPRLSDSPTPPHTPSATQDPTTPLPPRKPIPANPNDGLAPIPIDDDIEQIPLHSLLLQTPSTIPSPSRSPAATINRVENRILSEGRKRDLDETWPQASDWPGAPSAPRATNNPPIGSTSVEADWYTAESARARGMRGAGAGRHYVDGEEVEVDCWTRFREKLMFWKRNKKVETEEERAVRKRAKQVKDMEDDEEGLSGTLWR
ncbi:unnamed protein product [Zymoseptoria tritici ST99CH_3D1]|nr:unnamed protein product [Zymoseptoria tritici ST99CH_3D1]